MKYWAFISYSHVDAAWGAWLHRALELYRVPRKLVDGPGRDGPVPARLIPIFRDREELPVSADLSENIASALADSRYLIVICSPNAAASRWVNEEVLAFKRLGRANRVLAVIVDGEPGTSAECFPPALLHQLDESGALSDAPVEPIAADVRPGKDGKANAVLKVVAGLLGVNYDTLKARHAIRRRRQIVAAVVATTLIVGTAATVFGSLWRRTLDARQAQAAAQSGAALDRGFALMSGGPSAEALAWFARAARLDSRSPAAKTALMMALRDWQWPRWHIDGEIEDVQVPVRGALMATRDKAGAVKVWNLATGEERPLTSLLPKADAIAIDDAGTHLIEAIGNTVRTIDLIADQKTDVVLAGATQACFFLLDEGVLWAGANTGTVWRSAPGEPPAAFDLGFKEVASCYQLHHAHRGRHLAISGDLTMVMVDTEKQTMTTFALPSTVDALALSADAASLMATEGRAHWLFDTRTGRQVDAVIGSVGIGGVTMARNPVTSEFAVSGERGEISVSSSWPSTRDDMVAHLPGSGADVRQISFDADGQRLLSVDASDRVRVWTSVERSPVVFPEIRGLRSAAFTPDPLSIVTLGADGVDIWNLRLRGAGVIKVPQEHTSQIPEILFSGGGDRIAGRTWGNANLWTRATGEPLARLKNEDDPPAVSDDFQWGLTWRVSEAASETVVQLHDIETQRMAQEWKMSGAVTAAAFSADARQVAIVTTGGVFVGPARSMSAPGLLTSSSAVTRTSATPWTRVAWSADASAIILGREDAAAVISSRDGSASGTLDCTSPPELNRETATVACVTSAPDVSWLRAGADAGHLPAAADAAAVVGEHGRWLASTTGTDLRVVNLQTGAVAIVAVPRNARVLAVSDARALAAVATSEREIKVITLATALWSGQSMKHPAPVTVAAFSVDGRFLATGAVSDAFLWDVSSNVGQSVGPPIELPNNALSLRFAPDGRSLAIGAAQGWGTAFSPGTIVIVDLFVYLDADAVELANLAEAVAGTTVNEAGAVVTLTGSASRLNALRSSRDPFVSWFFADPWTRAVGPGAALNVPGYVAAKLRSGQFLEAQAEFPNHPLFAQNPRDVFVRPLAPPTDDEAALIEGMFAAELASLKDMPMGAPSRLLRTAVTLTRDEQWMVVIVHSGAYCGSGGCSFPATVLRKTGAEWTAAGEGICDATGGTEGKDGAVVLTTFTRSGHADFFCGSIRFVWTGSAYAQQNPDR